MILLVCRRPSFGLILALFRLTVINSTHLLTELSRKIGSIIYHPNFLLTGVILFLLNY